jgi:hypothetical protein
MMMGRKSPCRNPDYDTWVARDQFVQGWLNIFISPDILAHVLDTETTTEIWATISAMFKSASKAKVSHLRTALNNTNKKEMTAEHYISKITGFRSELAAAGKIIDDEEMIGCITAGLNNTNNALVDRVDNTPGISVIDVTNQINSFDMCQTLLADLDSDTGPFISSTNLGNRTTGGPSRVVALLTAIVVETGSTMMIGAMMKGVMMTSVVMMGVVMIGAVMIGIMMMGAVMIGVMISDVMIGVMRGAMMIAAVMGW